MAAVIALLGPTNTGKTFHAVERLLAHRTGMIGFPLRLLARENYDRLAAARGADAVALITGEERIVPAAPSYFVCSAVGKSTGRGPRALRPAEVGQIAGRAGRHTRDGTFGPTLDLGAFDDRLVAAVEGHHFEPLDRVFWRNSDLVFTSAGALLGSLEARPPSPVLVRMREADDHRALVALLADPDVK